MTSCWSICRPGAGMDGDPDRRIGRGGGDGHRHGTRAAAPMRSARPARRPLRPRPLPRRGQPGRDRFDGRFVRRAEVDRLLGGSRQHPRPPGLRQHGDGSQRRAAPGGDRPDGRLGRDDIRRVAKWIEAVAARPAHLARRERRVSRTLSDRWRSPTRLAHRCRRRPPRTSTHGRLRCRPDARPGATRCAGRLGHPGARL